MIDYVLSFATPTMFAGSLAVSLLFAFWYAIRRSRARQAQESKYRESRTLVEQQIHAMFREREESRIARLDDALHALVKNGHPEAEELVIDGMRSVFHLEPLTRNREAVARNPRPVSDPFAEPPAPLNPADYVSAPEPPKEEPKEEPKEPKEEDRTPFSAPIIPIPTGGLIAARPRREALFDHNIVPKVSAYTTFFNDTRRQANDQIKNHMTDTNLVGNGGSIPRGHYFRAFSFSLVADSTVPDEIYNQIHDKASVTLMLGATPYATYPARQCLTRDATRELIDLTVPGTIRKQTPQGVREIKVPRLPIEFAETECFGFRVNLENVERDQDIGLMLIMHGIYLKPLCG